MINIFGTNEPPVDWGYIRSGWADVAEAFKRGVEVYAPIPRDAALM